MFISYSNCCITCSTWAKSKYSQTNLQTLIVNSTVVICSKSQKEFHYQPAKTPYKIRHNILFAVSHLSQLKHNISTHARAWLSQLAMITMSLPVFRFKIFLFRSHCSKVPWKCFSIKRRYNHFFPDNNNATKWRRKTPYSPRAVGSQYINNRKLRTL